MQSVAVYLLQHVSPWLPLPPSLTKTTIVVPYYAMGRDTRYFSNPEEYNPDRWDRDLKEHHPFASLPFGFGPRACYGIYACACARYCITCSTCGVHTWYSCKCVHSLYFSPICVGRRLAELEMSLLLAQVMCLHV